MNGKNSKESSFNSQDVRTQIKIDSIINKSLYRQLKEYNLPKEKITNAILPTSHCIITTEASSSLS